MTAAHAYRPLPEGEVDSTALDAAVTFIMPVTPPAELPHEERNWDDSIVVGEPDFAAASAIVVVGPAFLRGTLDTEAWVFTKVPADDTSNMIDNRETNGLVQTAWSTASVIIGIAAGLVRFSVVLPQLLLHFALHPRSPVRIRGWQVVDW